MSLSAQASPSFARSASGETLAYCYSPGAYPAVVFLSGYASDMTGSKALYLDAWCAQQGRAFLRLDYSGHGASSGKFVDGTIGMWSEDALTVIREATDGPLVLVGSSMGGWIMLLVALALKDRLTGLIGIAAAPDFSEEVMWKGLDPVQRNTLRETGELYLASEYVDDPYPITLKLIEEARNHLLLGAPIELDCPVRLIHGLADTDVPWQSSLRLAERLTSDDVDIRLIKHGGHRLSEPEHLALIASTVATLVGQGG